MCTVSPHSVMKTGSHVLVGNGRQYRLVFVSLATGCPPPVRVYLLGAMALGWIASRSRPIRAEPRLTGGGRSRTGGTATAGW
jgi:hypothetical protein